LKHLALAAALGASFIAGSARAVTLTWNVSGGGSWDTSTPNWSGGATTFISDGSQDVIFSNTAGGIITVSPGMAPASTTVSAASGTYQFTSGSIAGSGSLTKSGGGWIRLSAANSFTGQTIHKGGTLWVNAVPTDSGVPGPLGAPTDANAIIDLSPGTTLVYDVSGTTNRPINLAGAGGTTTLSVHGNGNNFTFNGPITASGTGAKTFLLFMGTNQGFYGSGDGQTATINGAISDVSDAKLSLQVNLHSQSGGNNYVNLNGSNTFTGPIALVSSDFGFGEAPRVATVKIGGTGQLNSGNYPGAISMTTKAGGFSTIFNYASSMPQTLSGAISGAGALTISGSGTLTLSGANTYYGNTTVTSGGLILAETTGGLTFYVTNAATNKITGPGTATLNGTFTIDTSAVSVATGSWTLVDTTTKSFGSNFNLAGFGGTGPGVHTKADGLKTWTFDTSSGALSLTTEAVFTSFAYNGLAASIDNINYTVDLPVAYGTVLANVAPTFTVSNGTCNHPSGIVPTPDNFSTGPLHYIVTGAVAHDYLVTVTPLPAPPGGVSGGLVAWFDAAKGFATSLSGVTTWADQSGNGHTATMTIDPSRPGGTLTQATNQINGLPAVQFRSSAYANLDGTLFSKDQYIVFRIRGGDWGSVLGSQSRSGYLLNPNGSFWGSNLPAGVSQNDTTVTSLSNPGNFMVLKITGNSNDPSVRSGWALGRQEGWYQLDMDLAEILTYDHALTTGDEAKVGQYLSDKYGMITAYSPARILSFGITDHVGHIDQAAMTITLTVPHDTILADLAPTFTVSSGTCGQTSGLPPSPTTFADGLTQHYIVNGTVTNDYAVTVIVEPAPNAPPVASGLVCWYDASIGITEDAAGVTAWSDISGNAHTATRTAGTLTQANNQVNGLPTVQFRNAGYANIAGTMFAKDQYIVFKSPSGNTYNGDWGAVLGDVTDQHGYMMGNGTNFWNSNYPAAVSRNGTALSSPWNITNMGSFLVLKIVGAYPDTNPRSYSLGNVFGNGSAQYHNVNLDVAEIIAYDSVLSSTDEATVTSYLVTKYNIAEPMYRWKGANGANWSVTGNWNNSVPGATQIAILSDSPSAGATVNLDINAAVGGLTFNNQVVNQTIASTSGKTLTLSSVTVDAGSHTISAAVNATASGLTKSGLGAATLSGAASGGNLAVNGGELDLTGSGTWTGSLDVNSGGLVLGGTVRQLWASAQFINVGNGADACSLTINGSAMIDWSAATPGNGSGIVLGWASGQSKVIQNGGTLKMPPAGTSWNGENGSAQVTLGGAGAEPSYTEYQLNGGTLITPMVYNEWAPSGVLTPTAGSAVFKFNGGTLQGTMSDANSDAARVADGSAHLMGNLTHAYVGNNGAKIDTATFDCGIDQALEHDPAASASDGGLTKMGSGTLTLLRDSTYTGKTVVQQGTLVCPTVASLAPTALQIAATAVVDLAYSGNRDISSLKIGTAIKSLGVYGSSSSPAPAGNQDDVHFAGPGTVTVTGSIGYLDWASTYGISDNPHEDSNNDGVQNGIAYFMNNPNRISLPGVGANNRVTWINGGNIPNTEYGTGKQYVIQTSSDLVTWVDVPIEQLDANESGPGGSLSYTLQPHLGKKFCRLVVTPN